MQRAQRAELQRVCRHQVERGDGAVPHTAASAARTAVTTCAPCVDGRVMVILPVTLHLRAASVIATATRRSLRSAAACTAGSPTAPAVRARIEEPAPDRKAPGWGRQMGGVDKRDVQCVSVCLCVCVSVWARRTYTHTQTHTHIPSPPHAFTPNRCSPFAPLLMADSMTGKSAGMTASEPRTGW